MPVVRLLFNGLVAVLLLAAGSAAVLAQSAAPASTRPGPAVLVADQVYLQGRSTLVASGHVEALHGDVRIKASRITYDRGTDRLVIEGPITITQGTNVVVLANAAQMDAGFRDGILTGARMVLNQQLQLAALHVNRVNGRYSQLYKAAVTSCRVCGADEPPLWQIRARKVIHDQQEQQLYFHDAQFRVMDVPIFYLPRLRLPDPSLARATGFLIPNIRGNSRLGTGIKIPYFIRWGDHRDVTVTPYLSPKTRTVELRYRQAFRKGRIEFNGAVSQDTLTPGTTRAYLFGQGQFDLKRDFSLTFNIEAVTDRTYLFDYDYSDKDRLTSEVAVTRVRRDEFIRGAIDHYHSLRPGEDASTLPTIIGDLTYERRYFPPRLGGEMRMLAALHSHYRYSSLSTDGLDPDPFGAYADGLDVTRLTAEASWRNTWTLAAGLRAGAILGVAVDQFNNTNGGITVASQAAQVTPMAAFSLRWPWQKTTPGGSIHLIEPMVQLGWVGGNRLNVANDESTRVEFDEGNLLSLSRFPASDRRERGLSAAYGVSWTRLGADGWSSALTLGQVTRDVADADFTATSGLSGATSDLLVAGQIKSGGGLSLTGRALFDGAFDLNKAEARGIWQNPKLALGASYVWLGADPMENRVNTVSEWSLDGLYRISRHWSGSANVRYDVAANKAAEAGMGLQYRNECVEVDLSLSRRFTSSIILTPSTSFSFTVGLKGFSARTRDASFTRTCRN